LEDQIFNVKDTVVLVSGGSRGIGEALARGFADREATVIISGREKNSLQAIASKLSECSKHIEPIVCDVSSEEQVINLVQNVVKKYGKIDTLLNVAGVSKRKKIENFTSEEYNFIFDINLRGAFLLSQAVGRQMIKAKHGSIINIDSLNTYAPLRGVGVYAMSKAGVLMMTKAQALEWGRHKIRVNSIAPGFFPTKMTGETWKKNHMIEWAKTNTPLGKLGDVEELIGTAIFLASPASNFITGQTIRVDGGITAGFNWPLEI